MALNVEDGSGVADADALIALDWCTQYAEDVGLTDWTEATRSPPDDDEAAIRRATTWLSSSFRWKGVRTHGRAQGQAFPRDELTDGEGEDVPNDEVPVEIMRACAIAAAYERAEPGGLTPTVVMTDRVTSEKVGPIQVTYATAQQSPEASRPTLLRVLDMVDGLLSSTSSSLVGRAVRV